MAAAATTVRERALGNSPDPAFDWGRIAYLLHVSRALDELEEQTLVPEKKVLYQFSARGHDLAQILLGSLLTDPHDSACGYYRSRPMLLALGVEIEDALGSSMARKGGYSDGRDIGVVFNYPNPSGASALPMCGGVGAQYTPTAGWAQAVEYHRSVLGELGMGRRGWRGSRRRGVGGDKRLLVGPDHRDDLEAADALLHRRQRLRHLGAVHLSDSWRGHCRQFGQLQRAARLVRRRRRPVGRRPSGQDRVGVRPIHTGPLSLAPDRPAPAGPQLPGHPDL